MENQIFNIAYTPINENIEMTVVSISSLFENNQNNLINLYILYDTSLDQQKMKYFETFKKYKNCNNIKYIEINREKYQGSFPYTYFNERFYCFDFANLIDEDKLLYLNSFSIINDDISELYNIDLSENSCAAVESIHSQQVSELLNIKRSSFMPNVMLMNLKLWKEKKYYEKLLSKETYKNFEYQKLDETEIYNHIVDDCLQLNLKWNYAEAWHTNEKLTFSVENKKQYKQFLMHIEQPSILSYIGPKPVSNSSCKNSYLNLWWKYAEKTEIYNDIKEYRNSNKYKLSATSASNSFKYAWLLSRIWPYIKPYWVRILLGFAISIPLGLLDGVTAFALKPYMDYVVGQKALEFSILNHNFAITSMQMALIIPIGVVLFAILQGILRYLNGYLTNWVSAHITNNVKCNLFERLIHMHPQFFDDNSSGIILSRYVNDPTTAATGIISNLETITTSICGAIGLIAVMVYSSWKLAFIGVVVLCIAFIPVALIRKRIKLTSNKNMVIGGKITTNLNETYSGNKVMTAYGLQDRQNKYFVEKTWDAYDISMSLYKRAGWMSPMMYLIASTGIAIVLGYGTYLINTGSMTAGSFASFVTSLLLLYKPVKTLGNTLTGIQTIFVSMGRVFELFDLESAIKEPEKPVEMKSLENQVTFENVYFEYVPNNLILKDINLTIPKNETLAIVGNSGGGKSTLVNLLPRFYDIKSGSIKFDGTDIKDFSLKSLRENISMVFQDNFLFSGTIKENIMMGNPDASVEEMGNAIKSAHLQEMIAELPEGLETTLGERGLTLSGGQRQRVAIARAMLRNAPIVILDEATSALDNKSEAIVQKAMDNLMKDRTVFIIAHRLSTIKNADRIAVINEGELVEIGSHEELMQIENGQYKHLYEMQFKKQEQLAEV